MKFNEETINAAVESFMGDTFWKSVYDEAPEKARERLRIAFWGARYLNEKEDIDKYRVRREAVESEMTYEDAAYLAERFPKGQAGKKHYSEMRDRIEMVTTIMTPEKLDEAVAVMSADWPLRDREAVKATKDALDKTDDPFIKPEWLWKAVGGSGDDCSMLGDLFNHGHGVEPNEELAFFWFRKGALAGDGDSCSLLAGIYEREDSPRFDMSLAVFWFREALRRRSVDAKIDLGARLAVWDEGPWAKLHNPELGFRLLKEASSTDESKRSAYYLGRCYENGIGTEKQLMKAFTCYRVAYLADVYGAKEEYLRLEKILKEGKMI